MSAHFSLVLLALFSITAASDPACEELIKPQEDRSQVFGKYIFHVGTAGNEYTLKELKACNSSWVDISPVPDSDDAILRYGDKMYGNCKVGTMNVTLSGNNMTFPPTHEHFVQFLVTCPECLLWVANSVVPTDSGETKNLKGLYLLTKSGKLDEADLDVFKKQSACLNYLPELHFVDTTDLCPDEQEAATQQ